MNPFKILGIDGRVSRREIIDAAAKALRERKFSGREIAEAQKALLDPVSMAAHGFVQLIDFSALLDQLKRPMRLEEPVLADLDRLPIFEENP